MKKPQIIKQDGKAAFVVIPAAEWARIEQALADADDVRAYDNARRRRQEYFPADLVNAIAEGTNPIKAFREYRGLTQARLAKSAGLAPLYVSQLETGVREGPVKTLKAIAKVLKIDWDLLASESQPRAIRRSA